ncbi:hypothetical protein G6F42_022378 [Rhizopus arrhizus]|nr:hypothetical protein G6F42_022378 [Rhizopus arrhizus]
MIDEVIPYLLRRAQENSSVLGGVAVERQLMWEEVKDRITVQVIESKDSSQFIYGFCSINDDRTRGGNNSCQKRTRLNQTSMCIYQSFMQLYNNRLQCLESKQADAEDDATVPRNDQNWKRPTTILV